jgi:hypothetical protein
MAGGFPLNVPPNGRLIAAAANLAAQGFPVFPCAQSKKPCIGKKAGGRGFLDASLEIPEIERMFSHPAARLIGVPTGRRSGLDVLDLDYRHGAKAFEDANLHRLPETRIHQTQSGGRHLLFLHVPGVRNSASSLAPGVDVRGEGGYIIAPPSPGYSIVSDAEPTHWPDWLLELVLAQPSAAPARGQSEPRQAVSSARLERIIAAALAKVRAAADGQKHFTLRNQAILLGGIQHHAGFSDSEAVRWLMDALPGSAKDRAAAEATAAWGIGNGKARPITIAADREPVRPAAADEAPPGTSARQAPSDMGVRSGAADGDGSSGGTVTAGAAADPVTAVIDELNARYMVVNENGKAMVYEPGYDPILCRNRFDRISFEDFQRLYLNRLVQVSIDEKGNPQFKTYAQVWLRHRRRRQYIGGVRFDPSGATPEPDVLNLWKGFTVSPKAGDWALMRSHVFSIICDSDPVRFDYLMGWMARLVQRPAEQGEVAVVMKGGEGTGKGTLAKALLKIVGQHGLAISNAKHLVGNFNGHLRDAILLFADEAFFAGDKVHIGALKSIITEPYLTVEAKFQNAVQTPNFLHVIMASNEEWVVPAALDARRFFVLEVAEAAKSNHAYFADIWTQMEGGGYAAMLHDLLAYDLTTFNVRAVPVTEGLHRQRERSLGTTEAWWKDCLERGYVFKSKLGLEDFFAKWMVEVSTELLFASYSDFADKRHERHPLSRETLGRFMHGLGCQAKRLTKAAVGEHSPDEPTPFGGTHRVSKVHHSSRPPGYLIGDLATARESFTEATGLEVQWEAQDGAE